MSDRPNFLVIVTEQHRGDCLGIEGHPCLLTPNMDAIGASGVRFTKAYSTCPTCIAARRSLLSGQFPSTHGMVGYCEGVEWDAPTTIAAAMTHGGYQTAWVGRSMHQHPPRKRYGFEQIVSGEEYEDFLAREQPYGGGGRFGAGPMHNDWTARPWHLEERLHSTNWITERALEFLDRRDPSCPFFLIVSYHAAHPPLTPPAFYMERYLRADIPEPIIGDWETAPGESSRASGAGGIHVDLRGEALRACRAGYYGLINHLDDQLRRILNPRFPWMTGHNTVVIFTSDHGEMLGDHYLYHKIRPYESAARIPMMFSAPRRLGLASGAVCDRPVCLEDVMPTVLELAGLEVPESVEGRSLVPLLRGESPDWRQFLHIEHSPLHQSLTDGAEKFIWYVPDGSEQFFDLRTDPGERRNLIASPDHAERIDTWRQHLVDVLRDRPEGFVSNGKLVPGRPYPPVLAKGD